MVTDPSADDFGTHMPEYQRGRAWFRHMARSALGNVAGRGDVADEAFRDAQRLIGPLEEWDEDLLRDFIAGAMRDLEEVVYPDGGL